MIGLITATVDHQAQAQEQTNNNSPLGRTPAAIVDGQYPASYFPNTELLGPAEMRITALGTGMPNQTKSAVSIAYLVELGNGDKFTFDMGLGSMGNLFSLRPDFSKLDKVFASHLHIDHVGDFMGLHIGGWLSGRYTPIHIYGPTGSKPELGTKAFVEGMQKGYAWDLATRTGALPDKGAQIVVHEFDYKQVNEIVYQENGVTIRSWPAIHSLDGSVSYSLEWNGLKYVFGGDTYPNKWYIKHAAGADVASHEAFLPPRALATYFGWDLAQAAQNPIANLISLPLQNNTNFNVGPGERTQNVLNIQPVWPISLNENWNLITRTILPVMSQPLAGGGRENGLGNTTFTGFFSPKNSGKLTWGIGPVVLIPTSTDDALGADDWGTGLSAVLLVMPGHCVIGSLFSNVQSQQEDDGTRAVNLFTWQYFINYNIPDGNGLYLTTAPVITANWEADSDDRWTVPFGGGVGKIFKIGKQPVNGQASAYYNVDKPQFGADWQLRLQLQFLFPK